MPVAKIEPTGCTVRKGKVQLRFSFYLEPGDARYDEHHVQVPRAPGDDTPSGVWQDNPFHNHFVYVTPGTTDAAIRRMMADALDLFYGELWSKGLDIVTYWRRVMPGGKLKPGSSSAANIRKCESRVKAIKGRVPDFEVRKV